MSNLINEVGTYGLFLGLPLLFLAIVLWVYRPGAARRYRADGRIPFEDERGRRRDGHAAGPGAAG
ncbi:cbb3-type cytochrome c oxidase subunit 3 [Parasulfuritortus cantonensis]|uniref:Cbb3-type cytochrome c oxidase subunit 3 n=1 Tax=Parasulfuritortus cantonensis TaxID=2528202 RepID=A0A4R1B9A1_9PROT|nr:cbb3-type cytochrome c oxidase subunit 3 [Parasulfuritortus cantonensis]TCJ13423.1 cbb3-type cytochrome c oxidase subunit 3 [Parasulfuritortus cantonensis]